jgi:hypothetical protein
MQSRKQQNVQKTRTLFDAISVVVQDLAEMRKHIGRPIGDVRVVPPGRGKEQNPDQDEKTGWKNALGDSHEPHGAVIFSF